MNKLEIITHVWAKEHEQYAWHLQLQLTSIFRCAPMGQVQVTVCHAPDDTLTIQVLQFFRQHLGFNLRGYEMAHSHLFRRAIGRNVAALSTNADLVWFADVDYFWKKEAFETLCNLDPSHIHGLLMPQHVWRHKDWETGDRLVEQLRAAGVGFAALPPDEDFVQTREKIAIGGMQIVSGDFCRMHGYLDGTRWVQPLDPPPHSFVNFRDDIAFRRSHDLGRGHKIAIPQVYRVRHTENGYGREFGAK